MVSRIGSNAFSVATLPASIASRGAMEIEPADVADMRRDVHVRRIAGKPHAGEAVLHDVERFDHDGRKARPRVGR